MIDNKDFKGQSGYILLGLTLLWVGVALFWGSDGKQHLFFEYENKWAHFRNVPPWIGFIAFFVGLLSIYSGLRIAAVRCNKRIREGGVPTVTAILQFVFSLVLYVFFMFIIYLSYPFLITLRNVFY